MKKLIAIVLMLVMALSLCACGGNEERYPELADMLDAGDYEGAVGYIYGLYESAQQGGDGEGEGDGEGNEVIHTEPQRPTDEEWTVLYRYAELANKLRNYLNDDDYGVYYYDEEDNSYYGSEALGMIYNELLNMDTSVIDKWLDTEYTGTNYISYNNEAIDWDYNAVLARFSSLQDVLLKEVHTTLDNMENVSESWQSPIWYYNVDGSVLRIEYQTYAFELTESTPWNLSGDQDVTYDDAGKPIKIKYMSGDSVNYIVDITYDDAGNKIGEHIKQNEGELDITYEYDSQNRLVKIELPYNIGSSTLITYTYTYDDAGNMVKEEKVRHYIDTWYDTGDDIVEYKYIREFTYDGNGALVSGTYKYEDWNYNTDYHYDVNPSYYTINQYVEREKLDQYSFTTDDQGRPLTMTITYGDEVYVHGDNAGKVYDEPDYVSKTVEFIYGDYWFYTAE